MIFDFSSSSTISIIAFLKKKNRAGNFFVGLHFFDF